MFIKFSVRRAFSGFPFGLTINLKTISFFIIIMLLLIGFGKNGSGQTSQQTYTSPGTFSFKVPDGVTSIKVETWGGGGAGGGSAFNKNSGGGGGGGAYNVILNYSVTPGFTYSVIVGAGGTGSIGAAGSSGGVSSFNGVVTANGGTGGGAATNNTFGTGGAGGTGGTFAGGNGANGTILNNGNIGGGGGGSSAGNTLKGNNGSVSTGQTGGAGGLVVSGGGAGGNGGTGQGGNGINGLAPGGGGGGGGDLKQGGGTNSTGGNGANGQVIITWVCTPPTIAAISAPTALCAGDLLNPTTPIVTANGSTVTAQGWQKETSVGGGVFANLTVPYTVTYADNGKKIRYYATNSCGTTNSNEVLLTVNPLPETGEIIPD